MYRGKNQAACQKESPACLADYDPGRPGHFQKQMGGVTAKGLSTTDGIDQPQFPCASKLRKISMPLVPYTFKLRKARKVLGTAVSCHTQQPLRSLLGATLLIQS